MRYWGGLACDGRAKGHPVTHLLCSLWPGAHGGLLWKILPPRESAWPRLPAAGQRTGCAEPHGDILRQLLLGINLGLQQSHRDNGLFSCPDVNILHYHGTAVNTKSHVRGRPPQQPREAGLRVGRIGLPTRSPFRSPDPAVATSPGCLLVCGSFSVSSRFPRPYGREDCRPRGPENVSRSGLSAIFLVVTPGLWVWGEETTAAKWPSHQITSRRVTHDTTVSTCLSGSCRVSLILNFFDKFRENKALTLNPKSSNGSGRSGRLEQALSLPLGVSRRWPGRP